MSDTEKLPTAPVPLRIGERMTTATRGPLTRTDFVRYAGASGDFNPVHHDEPAALAAGRPTVFGMGMLHAGMLGNRLARWVGPDNLCSFGVRFTGIVWPGDTLTLRGQVVAIEQSASGPTARIELTVSSSAGADVLRGWATARVAAPS